MSDRFKNIHPNTKDLLSQILKSENVPSVLVFYGPKCEEKEFFALDLIEKLANPSKNENIKNRIFQKSHPDVQVFRAQDQEQYSISTVKSWVEEASLPPFELPKKWVVINDSEKLTTIHCNTLLKTLEEPIASQHFILLVESLSDLLDTVSSRAMKIPFFSLSKKMIEKEIQVDEILSQELILNLDLLHGTVGQLDLLKDLHQANFFAILHHIFLSYYKKQPQEAAASFEEVDKILTAERFNTKHSEIYSITVSYLMHVIKKIGEKKVSAYRKIPRLFELSAKLETALKRYTKLKYCIEQLAIELCAIS